MSATGDRTSAKEILSLLEPAKALIFDFDGTLVDSNHIKRIAFEKCLSDYPDFFDPIMEYCRGNNHVPRQVKFRHVFENILRLPYTAAIEKAMLDRYAAETTEQVISAQEIPGAIQFLQKFFFQKELVLLSSTPHDFLNLILERRGMKKYFKKIQGAPVSKADWLKEFICRSGFKNEEVLFFGDSVEDVLSAQKADISFVHVGKTNIEGVNYCIEDFSNFGY